MQAVSPNSMVARASIVVVGPRHCKWNEDEQVQGDDLIPRCAMHTLDRNQEHGIARFGS